MDPTIRPLRPGDPIPDPNQYTKEEWLEVCKIISPELTQEEYEALWQDFQAMKAECAFQAPLNDPPRKQ